MGLFFAIKVTMMMNGLSNIQVSVNVGYSILCRYKCGDVSGHAKESQPTLIGPVIRYGPSVSKALWRCHHSPRAAEKNRSPATPFHPVRIPPK
jgi:hypothetical protein